MRTRLLAVGLGATLMVTLAFCVPLALLVDDVARDRAVSAADRDAAVVAGAAKVTSDPGVLAGVAASTPSGAAGRLMVFLSDGSVIGAIRPGDTVGDEVALARASVDGFEVAADDGVLWVTATDAPGGVAVVRVVVLEADLERGVVTAWLALAAFGLTLVGGAVVVADRLARSVTVPAAALAAAAARVAGGDFDTRVAVTGPHELADVAMSFNHLAGRLRELLREEREGVADLAHRLRTPLTAMRLDAESVDDPDARSRLSDDLWSLERSVDSIIRDARRPEARATASLCDLGDVARDRAEFWSALADEQHRAWIVDIEQGRHLVAVAASDLRDGLDALIDNVFTHTPAGTGYAVRVSTSASVPDTYELVVSDDGPGIEGPAAVSRGRSTGGGSGLGLDIARRAAGSAGGTLRVDNDHGTVVTLALPAAKVPLAGMPAAPVRGG